MSSVHSVCMCVCVRACVCVVDGWCEKESSYVFWFGIIFLSFISHLFWLASVGQN